MAVPPRVLQHPLNAALNTLDSTIANLSPEFSLRQQDLILRARATVDLLRERLSDPAVGAISDSTLSQGHSWIQACLNELQNAIAQNNPDILVMNGQFVPNLDAISQNLGQFPVSQPSETVTVLAEEAQRRLDAMQKVQLQQETAWRAATDQQQRLISEAQEAKDRGMKRLQEQETAAGKLLAALGARGTSSGYAGTSVSEGEQADFWRWVTIGGGVLTSILAVVLFLTVHEQGISAIATRAGVTLPAILLTVYAGKQSSGHRSEERKAKRLELAFGSVDAYLADLNSDKRAELKTLLSSNLFGFEGPGSLGSPDGYPTSADLVGLLSEAIKRLR